MQKKIIALAVAAVASGAAFAQTNVVISGNLNYQLENISGTTPTITQTTAAVANREGRNRINENGSELKFAVTEDLGNGLKAGVVVASGIQPTETGSGVSTTAGSGSTSRGGLGGRDSYIWMGGNWGTILAGRMSVHYNSQSGVDTFGANTTMAANSLAILHGIGGVGYGSTTGTNGVGARTANTIAYVTPTVSGFNATFGYARPDSANSINGSLTEGVAVNNQAGMTNYVVRKESGWNVKVNFDNGPITAFASYMAHNDISNPTSNVLWQNTSNTALTAATTGATAAAAGTIGGFAMGTAGTGNTTVSTVFAQELRSFRMGAAYTLPMGLKLGLIYDNSKSVWRDDSNNLLIEDDELNIKRTAWVIPISWNFGPHTIGATYAKANNVQIGGSIATKAQSATTVVQDNGTGARYWMAGYQYAFSKRTNMGVTFARIDNDQRAGYDFFSNGGMGMYATATATNTRGSDPTSVSIGLKHSF